MIVTIDGQELFLKEIKKYKYFTLYGVYKVLSPQEYKYLYLESFTPLEVKELLEGVYNA